MKKLLTLATMLFAALAASGQGTVNFANRVTGTIDARFTTWTG